MNDAHTILLLNALAVIGVVTAWRIGKTLLAHYRAKHPRGSSRITTRAGSRGSQP